MPQLYWVAFDALPKALTVASNPPTDAQFLHGLMLLN